MENFSRSQRTALHSAELKILSPFHLQKFTAFRTRARGKVPQRVSQSCILEVSKFLLLQQSRDARGSVSGQEIHKREKICDSLGKAAL